MRAVDWKHIRNSVAIAVLIWPFAALIVTGILIALPLPVLSGTVPSALVFFLSVGVSAFMLGNLLAARQGVLHGLLSVSAALPTAALLTFLTLSAIGNIIELPPPSDWRLIRRFERNEAVFNELRDAVRGEGGLESISLARVEPADFEAVGISSEQLETYRTQMKRLKVLWVNEIREEPENVYFGVKYRGSSIEKYYRYLDSPPTTGTIVEKIRVADVEAFGTVYRPIGDGWYLYAYETSD